MNKQNIHLPKETHTYLCPGQNATDIFPYGVNKITLLMSNTARHTVVVLFLYRGKRLGLRGVNVQHANYIYMV